MTIILLGPAIISICALFGLFYYNIVIGLFIQGMKALMIATFTTYLFAFLAAKPVDDKLVKDRETLVKNIMLMEKVEHLACFKRLGPIEVDTPEKAERYIKRVNIFVW